MTGTELKTWRLKKGLTREALSRLLNVSTNTVYRWEAGARKVHAFLPDKLAGLKLKK